METSLSELNCLPKKLLMRAEKSLVTLLSLCGCLLTCGIVWLFRVHEVEGGWDLVSLAFTSKDDLALVVCATCQLINT